MILRWILVGLAWAFLALLWVAILALIIELFKTIVDIFRGKSSGCCSGSSWLDEYRERNGL
jgi:uncharacterized protein (DUF779 family)